MNALCNPYFLLLLYMQTCNDEHTVDSNTPPHAGYLIIIIELCISLPPIFVLLYPFHFDTAVCIIPTPTSYFCCTYPSPLTIGSLAALGCIHSM